MLRKEDLFSPMSKEQGRGPIKCFPRGVLSFISYRTGARQEGQECQLEEYFEENHIPGLNLRILFELGIFESETNYNNFGTTA